MHSSPQQLRGFSLLELLLVLIVAAGIILLGFNRYQIYRKERDIAAIKENIELLLQATTIYYHLNCHATPPNSFQVSIQNLQTAGLMPPLIDAAIANNYTVNATLIGATTTTQKPIYQLEATVTLNVPTPALSFYQQQLNATSASGNVLTWSRLPNYSINSTESGLWIARTGLHQFKEAATATNNNQDNSCAY